MRQHENRRRGHGIGEAARRARARRRRSLPRTPEVLEGRTLLAVYTPTIFTDSNVPGAGSLRDAIIAANDDNVVAPETDTIQLRAGTYTLSIPNASSRQENAAETGDLDITNTAHTLIIQGTGMTGDTATIIDQTIADRVFQVVDPGTTVVFRDLVIEGGTARDGGASGATPDTSAALGGGCSTTGARSP